MSKCSFCGHYNPAGVELCKGCGARIVDQSAQPAADQPTSGRDPEGPPAELDGLEGQVLAELRAGRKISAIKLYRTRTGAGLKEAKDAVEELAARHHVSTKGAGCATALLLLLAASAGLIAALA